ncbi:hypothetical protein J5N97_027135 [Dioscorea zingiberensis]|uniref:Uncharacterized protein n=1 Tax=Dioscorea zingiberensis TaxID=325984 RepID=A0A9D5C4Q4_9LILI|nr:hypothetical protein J5N97_027135 [Dioscorea zingiberensis]
MEKDSSSLDNLAQRVKEDLFSASAADHVYSFLPSSAYDTAWVAMIPDPGQPHRPKFQSCLDWILGNQNGDGGFWADLDHLMHLPSLDSLTATLACMLALKKWGLGSQNIDKGLGDPHPLLAMYLEVLPAGYINISPEECVLGHQNEDGSLFQSPSATAYAFMTTGNDKCMRYLETLVRRRGHGVPSVYPMDENVVRLCMVDHLSRLGCAERFPVEIGGVMELAYSNWIAQEGRMPMMKDVARQIYEDSLAFRLLRMHGYRVSPRRFCWFIHDDQLLSNMKENHSFFLGAMYSVHKAAHLTFSGEDELEKAGTFSRKILEKGLLCYNPEDGGAYFNNLQTEILHELELPWLARMDHIEHRKYIERSQRGYGLWIGKTSSIRLSCFNDITIRHLAQRNFNTRQSIYKAELEELKRWSKDVGFTDIGFGREKTAYCYYASAVTSCLPLLSDVRKIVAKCAVLVTVADDFFDEEGSLHELHALTKAVKRWDEEGLSGHSKVIFDALDGLVNDLVLRSSFKQGKYIKKILQSIKEVKTGKHNMVLLCSRENPQADIQDSVAHIMQILDEKQKELMELILMNDHCDVPKEWKKLYLSTLRTFQMFFNSRNLFDSPTALLEDLNFAIYDPLVLDAAERSRFLPESPKVPAGLRKGKTASPRIATLMKSQTVLEQVRYNVVGHGCRRSLSETKQSRKYLMHGKVHNTHGITSYMIAEVMTRHASGPMFRM